MAKYYTKQKQKPFVARTKDGDYFFSDEEEARMFALARSGFFDTVENIKKMERARSPTKRRWLENDK